VRLTHHESPCLEVDWAQRTFSLRTSLPSYLGKFTDDMNNLDPQAVTNIWKSEALDVDFPGAPEDHVLVVKSAVWDPEEWKMVFQGDIEGPQ